MAYQSRVSGEWRFDPPLNGHELRALPEFEWIKVRVQEDRTELDDGSEVVRQSGMAVVAEDGAWSFYELEDDLTALLAAITEPHQVLGYLVRSGEEQGDVQRYWCFGGFADAAKAELRTERATLRWNDGSKVDA